MGPSIYDIRKLDFYPPPTPIPGGRPHSHQYMNCRIGHFRSFIIKPPVGYPFLHTYVANGGTLAYVPNSQHAPFPQKSKMAAVKPELPEIHGENIVEVEFYWIS